MRTLIFDTETTGIPTFNRPSDHWSQPYIVQLAALLSDEDGDGIIEDFNTLVKPSGGWTSMPEEAEKVHGISFEKCVQDGMCIEEVMDRFMALMKRADLIVGHHVEFDKRMVRIALKRLGRDSDMVLVKEHPKFCTSQESAKIMKIAPSPASSRTDIEWGKHYKLHEAHEFFTGEEPEHSHDAMADTEACARIYRAIRAWHAQHGVPVSASKAKKPRTSARKTPRLASSVKSEPNW